MNRDAEFSPCRRWRYVLRRWWSKVRPIIKFIGLNPSSADEKQDDNTTRLLINAAKKWGYGGVDVYNLFAYKATEPDEMKRADDPVGVENDVWLQTIVTGPVVACWGENGSFRNRGDDVLEMLRPLEPLAFAVDYTKSGQPHHPLYLPNDTTLKPVDFGLFDQG